MEKFIILPGGECSSAFHPFALESGLEVIGWYVNGFFGRRKRTGVRSEVFSFD